MTDVSIRDLRNQRRRRGGSCRSCERITITRAGKAVAELRAVPRPPMKAEALLARLRLLPAMDANALRADIDQTLDGSL